MIYLACFLAGVIVGVCLLLAVAFATAEIF